MAVPRTHVLASPAEDGARRRERAVSRGLLADRLLAFSLVCLVLVLLSLGLPILPGAATLGLAIGGVLSLAAGVSVDLSHRRRNRHVK